MIWRALAALSLLPMAVPALCITCAASAGSGHAPDIFLLCPMDGSTVNDTIVRLGWTSVDPAGDDLAYTLEVSDGAGYILTRRLEAKNATLQLFDRSTYTWRVTVSDGSRAVASENSTFTVRLGRPPVIHSVPVLEARPGRAYVYQIVATDPDADSLSFRLVEGPGNMGLTPDGKVLWVPWSGQAGKTFKVAITVTDGELEQRQEFEVTVERAKASGGAAAAGPSPWIATGLIVVLAAETVTVLLLRRRTRERR